MSPVARNAARFTLFVLAPLAFARAAFAQPRQVEPAAETQDTTNPPATNPSPVEMKPAEPAPPPAGPKLALAGYVEGATRTTSTARRTASRTSAASTTGTTRSRSRTPCSTARSTTSRSSGGSRCRSATRRAPTTSPSPRSPGARGAAATERSVEVHPAGLRRLEGARRARALARRPAFFVARSAIEGIAVKDNWNWSRSNLFFGLPFYHTGLRATYELTDRLGGDRVRLNGWNSVVDNNDWKSIADAVARTRCPDRLTVSLLYFGGVERPTRRARGAALAAPLRRLGAGRRDELALVRGAGRRRLRATTTSARRTGERARSTRACSPSKWLYLAARGDRFCEHAATSSDGRGLADLLAGPSG